MFVSIIKLHAPPPSLCNNSGFNDSGEDVSWESFSSEQVAACPLHGSTSEHLGGSPVFDNPIKVCFVPFPMIPF